MEEELELEQGTALPEEAPLLEETSAMELPTEPAVRPLQEQELLEFAKDHPEVDAWSISPEVWSAVRRGDSLTKAFDRHELRQLRQSNQELQRQLGMERTRNTVRQRSLGSMHSTGGGQSTDSFLNGFNED